MLTIINIYNGQHLYLLIMKYLKCLNITKFDL